jgi:hypothetical protein
VIVRHLTQWTATNSDGNCDFGYMIDYIPPKTQQKGQVIDLALRILKP